MLNRKRPTSPPAFAVNKELQPTYFFAGAIASFIDFAK